MLDNYFRLLHSLDSEGGEENFKNKEKIIKEFESSFNKEALFWKYYLEQIENDIELDRSESISFGSEEVKVIEDSKNHSDAEDVKRDRVKALKYKLSGLINDYDNASELSNAEWEKNGSLSVENSRKFFHSEMRIKLLKDLFKRVKYNESVSDNLKKEFCSDNFLTDEDGEKIDLDYLIRTKNIKYTKNGLKILLDNISGDSFLEMLKVHEGNFVIDKEILEKKIKDYISSFKKHMMDSVEKMCSEINYALDNKGEFEEKYNYTDFDFEQVKRLMRNWKQMLNNFDQRLQAVNIQVIDRLTADGDILAGSGVVVYDDLTIKIPADVLRDSDIDDSSLQSTLYHELTHLALGLEFLLLDHKDKEGLKFFINKKGLFFDNFRGNEDCFRGINEAITEHISRSVLGNRRHDRVLGDSGYSKELNLLQKMSDRLGIGRNVILNAALQNRFFYVEEEKNGDGSFKDLCSPEETKDDHFMFMYHRFDKKTKTNDFLLKLDSVIEEEGIDAGRMYFEKVLRVLKYRKKK